MREASRNRLVSTLSPRCIVAVLWMHITSIVRNDAHRRELPRIS